MAYQLALPAELERYHDVFHVSLLRKCLADLSLIVSTFEVQIGDDLSYEEEPIQILDTKTWDTHNRTVTLVKVLWSRHGVQEATWETL